MEQFISDYSFWIVIFVVIALLMPCVVGRMNGEESDYDDERTGLVSDENNVIDKDISK